MRSVRQETVIKHLKRLDAEACAANSLWHRLESIKMEIAEDNHMSPAFLENYGIFIGSDRDA